MKKIVTLFLLSFIFCSSGFAQLSGPIQIDGRQIQDSISFDMEMTTGSPLVYDIIVNNKGEVTTCKLNRIASTQRSAKMQIMGRNKIIETLTFEAGTRFPKFHQGIITLVGVE